MMKQPLSLNIGDVHASASGELLACHGLGSCVGLFLYDRINRLGGGAHIFLAEGHARPGMTATCYAQGALDALVEQMICLGGRAQGWRASIFGGARLFDTSYGMGARNVSAVQRLLAERRIYLAHQEVGGTQPRSVTFDTATGEFQLLFQDYKHSRSWVNAS